MFVTRENFSSDITVSKARVSILITSSSFEQYASSMKRSIPMLDWTTPRSQLIRGLVKIQSQTKCFNRPCTIKSHGLCKGGFMTQRRATCTISRRATCTISLLSLTHVTLYKLAALFYCEDFWSGQNHYHWKLGVPIDRFRLFILKYWFTDNAFPLWLWREF